MKKKAIRYLAGTVAMVLVGVFCFGELETDATKDVVNIPENRELDEFEDSLVLNSYTTYSYTDNGSCEYRYRETGILYYSREEMIYEIDGCTVKKIYEVRPSATEAIANLYTYRYLDDKTLGYMDKYNHGVYEYGRGWVWDKDGREQLDVQYDAEGNVESVDCSYYDEEGRLAYEFSDLPNMEENSMNAADISSYQYKGDYTVFGYIQGGISGEKKICSRKDEMDGKVLLEAECTGKNLDELTWYSYDEEGKLLYEVVTRQQWGEEYNEIEFTHYLYDEQGRCKESYTYQVVGDINVQDTGLYSGEYRSYAALFDGKDFPTDIIIESSDTEPVVIWFDLHSGEFLDMGMGEN